MEPFFVYLTFDTWKWHTVIRRYYNYSIVQHVLFFKNPDCLAYMLVKPLYLYCIIHYITPYYIIVRIERLNINTVYVLSVLFPRVFLVESVRFLTSQPETEWFPIFIFVEKHSEVAGIISVEDTFSRSFFHRKFVILRSCRIIFCVVRSRSPSFTCKTYVIPIVYQYLWIESKFRREMWKVIGSLFKLPRVFTRQYASP